MTTNPLRILDSKHPGTRALLVDAPQLTDYLPEANRQHFAQLQAILRHAGLAFTVNPYLVRGLDYYSDTVFEWVTEDLGAQGVLYAPVGATMAWWPSWAAAQHLPWAVPWGGALGTVATDAQSSTRGHQ